MAKKNETTTGLMILSIQKPPNAVCNELSVYRGYWDDTYTLLPRARYMTSLVEETSGPPVNTIKFLIIPIVQLALINSTLAIVALGMAIERCSQ